MSIRTDIERAIDSMQQTAYEAPCGSFERPHLIHPRDWAEGNLSPCANLCGAVVDPKNDFRWSPSEQHHR